MRWVHTAVQLVAVGGLAYGLWLLTGQLGWVFAVLGGAVFLLSVVAEGLSPERVAAGQRAYVDEVRAQRDRDAARRARGVS